MSGLWLGHPKTSIFIWLSHKWNQHFKKALNPGQFCVKMMTLGGYYQIHLLKMYTCLKKKKKKPTLQLQRRKKTTLQSKKNKNRKHMCSNSFVCCQDMPLAWLTFQLCLCSGCSVQTETKVRLSAGKSVIRDQTAKLPMLHIQNCPRPDIFPLYNCLIYY